MAKKAAKKIPVRVKKISPVSSSQSDDIDDLQNVEIKTSKQEIEQESSITEVSWSFQGKNKTKRPIYWYVIAVIIAMCVFYYAISHHEYLFAFLTMLLIFTFWLVDRNEKQDVSIILNRSILIINGKNYRIEDFTAYEIEDNQDKDAFLMLKGKKLFNLTMSLPIGQSDKSKIASIKKLLSETLKEGKITDPIDKIMNKLKI